MIEVTRTSRSYLTTPKRAHKHRRKPSQTPSLDLQVESPLKELPVGRRDTIPARGLFALNSNGDNSDSPFQSTPVKLNALEKLYAKSSKTPKLDNGYYPITEEDTENDEGVLLLDDIHHQPTDQLKETPAHETAENPSPIEEVNAEDSVFAQDTVAYLDDHESRKRRMSRGSHSSSFIDPDMPEDMPNVREKIAAYSQYVGISHSPFLTTSSAHSWKNLTAIGAKKSTKALTVPIGFNAAEKETIASQSKRYLAPKSPGITKVKRPPPRSGNTTIPEPFKFHSTTRENALFEISQNSTESEPFIPLSERILKFQKKESGHLEKRHAPAQPRQLTIPLSPNFRSGNRNPHARNAKSTEEQELEEFQKHQFKAHAVNKKVLDGAGDLGVPRVKKAALTVPKSPTFQPMRSRDKLPLSDNDKADLRPSNDSNKPFKPKIEHRLVIPEEVRLPGDERAEMRKKQWQEKMKRELARHRMTDNFLRANSPTEEKPKTKPQSGGQFPLTEPVPFTFETSARGERYQKVFRERLAKWQEREEKSHDFRALPVPKFSDKPYVPAKSTKPPTVAEDVHLNLDTRAHERMEYEQAKAEREHERSERKRKAEEEAENERLRQLRRSLIHKPEPISSYPAIAIHPSDRPVTKPVSPKFSDRWRHRFMSHAVEGHSSRIGKSTEQSGKFPSKKQPVAGRGLNSDHEHQEEEALLDELQRLLMGRSEVTRNNAEQVLSKTTEKVQRSIDSIIKSSQSFLEKDAQELKSNMRQLQEQEQQLLHASEMELHKYKASIASAMAALERVQRERLRLQRDFKHDIDMTLANHQKERQEFERMCEREFENYQEQLNKGVKEMSTSTLLKYLS
ncbi:hypothetical protein BZG36_03478 [Bifiguratus adelaidae]|uniref:TPX2 C-terminal domain-containing protein n=1 Tax=Bifiguratus adelaidae TaxID=1938954 RepID=A0A261XWQ5_9FUNG|nr:hypothetical protein BZG36_03478 [Bifiguratus adelaidae]